MKKFLKIINKYSKVLTIIASLAFILVLLLVVINVIGRSFFHYTISGIVEIVQYGMLVVMVLVLSKTCFSGTNVRVSIIIDKLSGKAKAAFEMFAMTFSAFIFLLCAYVCLKLVPASRISGLTTDRYKIPFYIIYAFLTAGLLAAVLAFIGNGLTYVFKSIHGEEWFNDEKDSSEGKEA